MVSSNENQITKDDAEHLIQVVTRNVNAKVVLPVFPQPRDAAYQSNTTGKPVSSRCHSRKVISRHKRRRHFASVAEYVIEETGNILRAESKSPN